jgi:hypothetical protein
MKYPSEDLQGYIIAAVCGAGLVSFILVFICVFHRLQSALRNRTWLEDAGQGFDSAPRYRRIAVGLAAQQSGVGEAGSTGEKHRGKRSRAAGRVGRTRVVPLGLRGRGISVPGEELRRHVRPEEVLFSDGHS